VAEPSRHAPADRPLSDDEAAALAETLKALAHPVRLLLMTELLGGERSVEDLAAASGQSMSATSHNLRLLRAAKLVRTRRDGRSVLYRPYDHHIAPLLGAIRHHHEHL
jgi:DNA-binding transcriptional ArsR family regulator